jgi:hypothetical protein
MVNNVLTKAKRGRDRDFKSPEVSCLARLRRPDDRLERHGEGNAGSSIDPGKVGSSAGGGDCVRGVDWVGDDPPGGRVVGVEAAIELEYELAADLPVDREAVGLAVGAARDRDQSLEPLVEASRIPGEDGGADRAEETGVTMPPEAPGRPAVVPVAFCERNGGMAAGT